VSHREADVVPFRTHGDGQFVTGGETSMEDSVVDQFGEGEEDVIEPGMPTQP
jgi:hypothetical protein